MKKIILAVLAALFFASCQTDGGGSGGKKNSSLCPEFSPKGGFYKQSQTVSISTAGAQSVYYTILKQTLNDDCSWNEEDWQDAVASSKPTENSTLYTAPFTVDEQCIVRAVAVYSDGTKHYSMTSYDFDLDRSTDFDGSWTPVNPESENWQDQTIYFILTDRFFNGDTTNDHIDGLKDPDGNDYDERIPRAGQPTSGYNGGDIEGIRQKLQYIKDLGFTAIWMTPPVKCQIQEANYHGFHGYWASDFTKVDSHMGTLEQYQAFVKEAHSMGLYVIQDIVVNHLGDYQQINEDVNESMWNSENESWDIPESQAFLEPKSIPFNHPEQLPWALNNIRDLTFEEWKNNSFYHYNTPINDFNNPNIQFDHSSSNLDDIVTESEVCRNLLRGYFRYWIDKCGIDGYRIDTALYVEPDFFADFINSTDSGNMGVRPYGISKGKKDFINFGEAFSQDEGVCGSYTKDENGNPRMDGMLYFPLRYAIADTISSGSKTEVISEVLKNRYSKNYYQNPDRLVTFIDNHDMDRWGHTMKGNEALMKAAYGIIYTIPGIPQVYYGSEQGFDGECREGMFAGSFVKQGVTKTEDSFDTNSSWYKYFAALNKMRKDYRVFRYNDLRVLQDTSDSAGIFAYLIREKDESTGKALDGVGKKAIFVMNTASTDKVMDASDAYIKTGDKFILIDNKNTAYSGISACTNLDKIEGSVVATKEGSKGNIKIIVPAQSCAIYILDETGQSTDSTECKLEVLQVPTSEVSEKFITIKGKSTHSGTVKIVLNGDYSRATDVSVSADVEFSASVNVAALSNGKISVQFVQTIDDAKYYSAKKYFNIKWPMTLVAKVTDPDGDDNGVGVLQGELKIPTQKAFIGAMDIHGVDVYRTGNDVLLGIRMNAISHSWNPTSNLFDHVVFYVFISDGDDNGCAYHPQSNYELPASFGKWDYLYQCNGWGQGYYSSVNADADSLGTAVTPAPEQLPAVDWAHITQTGSIKGYATLDWSDYNPEIGSEWADKPGMIWIKISAASMGYPSDISGYKFYINTWDFDMGNPRGIVKGEPEEYKFGTGDTNIEPEKGNEGYQPVPFVCDELDNIITISEN